MSFGKLPLSSLLSNLRLALVLAVFSCVLLTVQAEADEAFVIDRYQVDIEVQPNNAYEVTEHLEVDFSEQRHGLIRKLPLRFDQGYVRVDDVVVEGAEYVLMEEGDVLSIRIGSADRWVEGRQSYEIRYHYDVGADRLSDMDEFNDNVIGLDWDTTIKQVDFSIRMPKAFDATKVNCTSGEYGSTNNKAVAWSVDGLTITGHTLKPLGSYEGLTVALPLPEGYWEGAKLHEKPGAWLWRVLGYPVYILTALLSLVIWFTKGRDKKLYPTVEFDAPEDLTPVEIGYIIDGRVDASDVTSLVLYWADQGYLEIEQTDGGKGLKLSKLKELGKSAKSFERFVFKKLFELGQDGVVSTDKLENKFFSTLTRAIHDVTYYYEEHPERAIFAKGSKKWTALVALLSVIPFACQFAGVVSSFSGKGPMWLLGLPLSFLFLLPAMKLGEALNVQNSVRKGTVVWMVLLLAGLLAGYSLLLVRVMDVTWMSFCAGMGSCLFSALMVAQVAQRTAYGDRILARVLGFKEFINAAERERLELMFDANPSFYYKILPYAMVLGLSRKWSSHFAKMELAAPTWYHGYRYDRFDVDDFNRDLHRSMSHLSQSMVSSPSSSGTGGSSGSSSSGGFSGGGSGGGGGSSW